MSSVLGFGKYVETISEKATKTVSALTRLMSNVRGPSAEKRKLLATVVHSQLTYAAPIWHGAIRYAKYKAKLSSPQRKMALRVACTYCTVSNNAIMVVTGTVSIHQLASEKAEVEVALKTSASPKNAKQETRSRTMDEWQ